MLVKTSLEVISEADVDAASAAGGEATAEHAEGERGVVSQAVST